MVCCNFVLILVHLNKIEINLHLMIPLTFEAKNSFSFLMIQRVS